MSINIGSLIRNITALRTVITATAENGTESRFLINCRQTIGTTYSTESDPMKTLRSCATAMIISNVTGRYFLTSCFYGTISTGQICGAIKRSMVTKMTEDEDYYEAAYKRMRDYVQRANTELIKQLEALIAEHGEDVTIDDLLRRNKNG